MISWLKRLFARAPAKTKLEVLAIVRLEYGEYVIKLRNGPQVFAVRGKPGAWYHQPEDLPCSSTFTRRMDGVWQRLDFVEHGQSQNGAEDMGDGIELRHSCGDSGGGTLSWSAESARWVTKEEKS